MSAEAATRVGEGRRPAELLLGLQRTAGNAAVARAVQRVGEEGAGGKDRPVELRMLDRFARTIKGTPGVPKSPHYATAIVPRKGGYELLFAGNSGVSRLRPKVLKRLTGRLAGRDDRLGDANIDRDAMPLLQDERPDKKERGKQVRYALNRRADRDREKLWALARGGYHWKRRDMHLLATGAGHPRLISNPARESGDVHGEMVVLGELLKRWRAEFESGEGGARTPVEVTHVGGVKKACAACQWVFEAVNETIGATYGRRVVASGTHGTVPKGWAKPPWLAQFPEVAAVLNAKAKPYLDREMSIEYMRAIGKWAGLLIDLAGAAGDKSAVRRLSGKVDAARDPQPPAPFDPGFEEMSHGDPAPTGTAINLLDPAESDSEAETKSSTPSRIRPRHHRDD
ncbi:hypothetical protein [Actinorhabdospora filicis]|uniref:hypothetical protein n=1 Tax=Actinorhabdospora filicis TaxID=1785913 RepID=UPI002553D5A2|nr:hypothetical protein [Actinorhabdospora filicis]